MAPRLVALLLITTTITGNSVHVENRLEQTFLRSLRAKDRVEGLLPNDNLPFCPPNKAVLSDTKTHNGVNLAACSKIPDSRIPCDQFYGEYVTNDGNVYNRKCKERRGVTNILRRISKRLVSGKCAADKGSDHCKVDSVPTPNQGTSDSTPGNVPKAAQFSSKAVPAAALVPSTADHGNTPGKPMTPNKGTSDSTPGNVPKTAQFSSKAVPAAALVPSTADHGTDYDNDIYMDVMQPTPASERKPTAASKRKHSPGGTFKDIDMDVMQPTEPSIRNARAF